ncbi:HNH endonuclease family protein [Flavimobilis rhizosphaerae]|uniref:HNH endonuclease family protein n=1 Tax=Flavimobilis rhizosphaerae TaxID=2775421 RepID=UPI001B358105|nr:HNH endonuclease family protein [Flavimobilis rhizosphaerae]
MPTVPAAVRPALRAPRPVVLVAVCVALLALAWWVSVPWRAPALTYPVTGAELAAARASLAALPELTAEPPEPYTRTRFGTPWADLDGNGCSTREDMLARDLVDAVRDDDGCTVLTGTLTDRYTGQVLPFRRGPTTSARVQIDHVVALADAWRTGAWAWDDAQRARLANDPANLLAVDGPTNEDKGAQDPSTWLPPYAPFRCQYAVLRVRVRAGYGLALVPGEREALGRALGTCDVAEITVTEEAARH